MSRDPSDRYPPAVADRWEDLLADARATAEEYREDGWDVRLFHPGDVVPLTDDPFGLDVLLPSNEFEELRDLVDGTTIDETRVFRAEDDGVRFYVLVLEAAETDEAVVVPAFLALSEAPALERRATDEGVMYTHLRPLSTDVRVTVSHEDPTLFF